MATHQRTNITYFSPSVWIHQVPFGPLHAIASRYHYKKPRNYELSIIQWLHSPYLHLQVNIMDATHYWPFAWEYSIWNAAVAALQFWTADLEPHISQQCNKMSIHSFLPQQLCTATTKLSEEVLFSCFLTTLNDTLEIELVQEDESYESGSGSLNIHNASQKSTMNIPCINKWEFILQS